MAQSPWSSAPGGLGHASWWGNGIGLLRLAAWKWRPMAGRRLLCIRRFAPGDGGGFYVLAKLRLVAVQVIRMMSYYKMFPDRIAMVHGVS
jgi:hypothetical protein